MINKARHSLVKEISRTWVLYLIFAVIVLLFCNFDQARTQRLYELDRYRDALTGGFDRSQGDARLRVVLRYYTLLGQKSPQIVRTDEMRGLCYVLLGDDRRAIDAFNKVLQRRPGFFWVEFEKGMALYRLHRWDEAMNIFNDIASRSNDAMFKAGILPSISLLPKEMRNPLIGSLLEFVFKIKAYSAQMIPHCLNHDPDLKQGLLGIHPWAVFTPRVTQPFID